MIALAVCTVSNSSDNPARYRCRPWVAKRGHQTRPGPGRVANIPASTLAEQLTARKTELMGELAPEEATAG